MLPCGRATRPTRSLDRRNERGREPVAGVGWSRKERERRKALLNKGLGFCSKCKSEKPVKEFWREEGGSTGLKSWCKACDSLRKKEPKYRYQKNSRARERWAADPEVRRKQRARKSTPKYRAWVNAYLRKKWATDPEWREKENARKRRNYHKRKREAARQQAL